MNKAVSAVVESTAQPATAQASSGTAKDVNGRPRSAVWPRLKKQLHWLGCLLAIMLVSLYWGGLASDRYVSEANVVLESPQINTPGFSLSALMGGSGSRGGDMLLLRDYLLSVDMLRRVEAQLGFREHYSADHIDWFSRLGSQQVPLEALHEYYRKRVSVELDDYAGVLRIRVTAFSPQVAHDVTRFLLAEGEKQMNRIGQRLAREQVRFLEKQVNELSVRFEHSRQVLLDYQNKNGLISPTGTVENLSAVVAQLESQKAILEARRSALASYQSARSPELLRVDSEISALQQQIEQREARMTRQSGDALNAVSSGYQRLELRARFAQESYSGALAALENTRIEAARKLRQLSVLQSPTLPEYPVEPRRLYNIAVFTLIIIFLTLIAQMMMLIIRDHRD